MIGYPYTITEVVVLRVSFSGVEGWYVWASRTFKDPLPISIFLKSYTTCVRINAFLDAALSTGGTGSVFRIGGILD